MKNVFALWVMALMLVLLAGGSAVALEDPFLDGIWNPTNTTINEGSEEDDHPWGGDQSPGVSTTTTTTTIWPTQLIVTTGILPIDQLITSVVYFAIPEIRETERVSSVSSRTISAEKTSRYRNRVQPSRAFSNKRGVTR